VRWGEVRSEFENRQTGACVVLGCTGAASMRGQAKMVHSCTQKTPGAHPRGLGTASPAWLRANKAIMAMRCETNAKPSRRRDSPSAAVGFRFVCLSSNELKSLQKHIQPYASRRKLYIRQQAYFPRSGAASHSWPSLQNWPTLGSLCPHPHPAVQCTRLTRRPSGFRV